MGKGWRIPPGAERLEGVEDVTMRRFSLALLAVVAPSLLLACKSTTPTDTPELERLGQYVLRHRGPEAEVVLGYRFAAGSIGDEWLFLEVAMSAPPRSTPTVLRENVWVRKPDGTRVELASQAEFGRAYADLRAKVTRAKIKRDPLNYFPVSRRPCRLGFFVEPGKGVTFDRVTLDNRQVCQGRLYFAIPGGIQPGRWALGIDLEEERIQIPFVLKSGDEPASR